MNPGPHGPEIWAVSSTEALFEKGSKPIQIRSAHVRWSGRVAPKLVSPIPIKARLRMDSDGFLRPK